MSNPFEGQPGVKFMRHHGRDACPCSPRAIVDVIYRDGVVGTGRAGPIMWRGGCSAVPDVIGWRFAAQRIEARSDETPQAVQPEGREPGPKDAPNPYPSKEGKND